MTIAIDLDGTWTGDPILWNAFVASMNSRGHQAIIATGRSGWSHDMARHNIPSSMKIVYCSGRLKREECQKQGFQVDIWVDDSPGSIEECKVLSGDL